MIKYFDGLENIIRNHFSYKVYEDATDGNPITRKLKKKKVKSTGESAQAFVQFLSTSAMTGTKYADFNKCWKRKPKLDCLAITEGRNKKQKQDGRKATKVQEEKNDNQHV
eukprot:3697150-Ditylum_brightwellii.AAC.1